MLGVESAWRGRMGSSRAGVDGVKRERMQGRHGTA
jgi:hypothetical protein